MKGKLGNANGDRIGCVEAEEPNARFSVESYVCANVEFRESRKPRDGGHASRRYVGHVKWNDRDPSLAVVSFHLNVGGQASFDFAGVKWPMSKQQVVPTHPHRVGLVRQRPGSIGLRGGLFSHEAYVMVDSALCSLLSILEARKASWK